MWHVYGIGLNIDKVEEETYISFLKKHKKSLPPRFVMQVDELIHDCAKDHDLLFLSEMQEITDNGSISWPIAQIITAETGVRFDCPGRTEDDEDYVLFTKGYPWRFNEKERGLDEMSLTMLLEPYAKELGIAVEDDVDLVYAG